MKNMKHENGNFRLKLTKMQVRFKIQALELIQIISPNFEFSLYTANRHIWTVRIQQMSSLWLPFPGSPQNDMRDSTESGNFFKS